MDYESLIKNHLEKLEALSRKQPQAGVETFCVFDDTRKVYLLQSLGWTDEERVCGSTLYIRIIDGKIWIEEDWTDGIAYVLLRNGVPKEDIVLGFKAPEDRPYTEYELV